MMMASAEGGMEIEKVAAKTPEKILKEWVDPAVGLMPFQARKLAFGLGIPGELTGKAVKFMTGLYKAFVDTDCSLAEINPLVLTEDGDIVALDAKMNFDDNGLFRHKDIEVLRDFDEEDPTETEASAFRPVLHQPRRQHRLHGQRRGAGDGHDGHDQALRRRAGELPRRGRRRDRRAGDRTPSGHPVRREREGDPGQHLRRHHAVRHHRRGVVAADEDVGLQGAAGRPARRDERGEGEGDPGGGEVNIMPAAD